MAIVGFDHPFLSGLLGDDELAILLSADAELQAMIRFRGRAGRGRSRTRRHPDGGGRRYRCCGAQHSSPAMAELRQATGRDGVVVPELVRQLRLSVGEPHGQHVHFGATSQDVIDTALMLRLKIQPRPAGPQAGCGRRCIRCPRRTAWRQYHEGPYAHAARHCRSPSRTGSAVGADRVIRERERLNGG